MDYCAYIQTYPIHIYDIFLDISYIYTSRMHVQMFACSDVCMFRWMHVPMHVPTGTFWTRKNLSHHRHCHHLTVVFPASTRFAPSPTGTVPSILWVDTHQTEVCRHKILPGVHHYLCRAHIVPSLYMPITSCITIISACFFLSQPQTPLLSLF